jgi:hypothetical protein
MRLLYISVDDHGILTGKISQPCLRDAFNPSLPDAIAQQGYDIDTGALWDGKSLHIDWDDHDQTFTGSIQDDKLVGLERFLPTKATIRGHEVTFPESHENVTFTRGQQGCETDLDVRAAQNADPDQDYPIIGYWHSAEAQLHVIDIRLDGHVLITETYPCLDRAQGSTIDEASTHWDGKTLSFTLPPMVAPHTTVEGNAPYKFELRKFPAKLMGTMVSQGNHSSTATYLRGKLTCAE